MSMLVLLFLIQFMALLFKWRQGFTAFMFLLELVSYLYVFYELLNNILQSNTILVLKLLFSIGILLMLFGYFCSSRFSTGVAFYLFIFISFSLTVCIFYKALKWTFLLKFF